MTKLGQVYKSKKKKSEHLLKCCPGSWPLKFFKKRLFNHTWLRKRTWFWPQLKVKIFTNKYRVFLFWYFFWSFPSKSYMVIANGFFQARRNSQTYTWFWSPTAGHPEIFVRWVLWFFFSTGNFYMVFFRGKFFKTWPANEHCKISFWAPNQIYTVEFKFHCINPRV